MTILRGLPAELPAGERLLWRGAPDWRVLSRRALHTRKLALYFGALIAAVGVSAATGGGSGQDVAMSMLRAAGFGAIPIAVAIFYAWAAARDAVYTITDRRVVLHVGLAVPVTINLPFANVASADVLERADGSGDISLVLTGRSKLAYIVLWPHVRPWHFGRPQPTLRALKEVAPVAQLLARALAASADMTAPVLHSAARNDAVAPHATMAA